jgi:hypothetical protein
MCSLQEHIIGPLDACPKRQVPFPMLAFLPSSEMSGDLELIVLSLTDSSKFSEFCHFWGINKDGSGVE